MKPRVYWVYYPKLKRGFWRVSPMTPPVQAGDYQRWRDAHSAVAKVNSTIVRENHADQVTREMRRQSH